MWIFISSFAVSDELDLHTSRPIPPKLMPRRSFRPCCTVGTGGPCEWWHVDEGWSRDVSEAIAAKVRDVAQQEGRELTSGTLDFIDAQIGRVVQPTLPLW